MIRTFYRTNDPSISHLSPPLNEFQCRVSIGRDPAGIACGISVGNNREGVAAYAMVTRQELVEIRNAIDRELMSWGQ